MKGKFVKFVGETEDLKNLCDTVRNNVREGKWEECEKLIPKYMELYPHSAVPHNLMGIVLEKRRKHVDAMRHFRAAAALDASYKPVNFNMELFSAFEKMWNDEPAFDIRDCERLSMKEPPRAAIFF